jgi:hypothetical protein
MARASSVGKSGRVRTTEQFQLAVNVEALTANRAHSREDTPETSLKGSRSTISKKH